jgi:hypothetical protein
MRSSRVGGRDWAAAADAATRRMKARLDIARIGGLGRRAGL